MLEDGYGKIVKILKIGHFYFNLLTKTLQRKTIFFMRNARGGNIIWQHQAGKS
jgi:hypothetical protein